MNQEHNHINSLATESVRARFAAQNAAHHQLLRQDTAYARHYTLFVVTPIVAGFCFTLGGMFHRSLGMAGGAIYLLVVTALMCWLMTKHYLLLSSRIRSALRERPKA